MAKVIYVGTEQQIQFLRDLISNQPDTHIDNFPKEMTENEQAIEIAYEFLSPSDEHSIEEMVEFIVNNKDQEEMIDWVSGVNVVERFEHTFSCQSFLEQINYK